MQQGDTVGSHAASATRATGALRRPRGWRSWLLGGGTDGNEMLTTFTGLLLLVLFAVLGITIVRVRQLIWLHLFLGLLLIGPVVLKIASTAYRAVRYYTREAPYLAKGPPLLALRVMGPIFVLTTMVVFVSGIVLLALGPHDRSIPLTIHKVSFIFWLVLLGLHLLGHVPEIIKAFRPGYEVGALGGPGGGSGGSGSSSGPPATGDLHALSAAEPGTAGRWIALASAIVGGAVVAVILIPHFGIWTAPGAFPHHHHFH